MRSNSIKQEYFLWMLDKIVDNVYAHKPSYSKLMDHLNEREFIWIHPMDANRADDGVDLRYRFGYESDYDQRMIVLYLDDRPCSILEMMIALAIRCEEDIMGDPNMGDRIGQWFWEMIVSLGLGSMYDDNYDENYVDHILDRFINREYEPNGKGGLFTIEGHRKDLTSVEIWYQMNWYLDDILE